jgi:hypothetical protein
VFLGVHLEICRPETDRSTGTYVTYYTANKKQEERVWRPAQDEMSQRRGEHFHLKIRRRSRGMREGDEELLGDDI